MCFKTSLLLALTNAAPQATAGARTAAASAAVQATDCITPNRRCLRLTNHDGAPGVRWPRGQAERLLPSRPYVGKRVRFSASARAEVGRSQNAGRLRLRVVHRDGSVSFEDSGYQNPIKSSE